MTEEITREGIQVKMKTNVEWTLVDEKEGGQEVEVKEIIDQDQEAMTGAGMITEEIEDRLDVAYQFKLYRISLN